MQAAYQSAGSSQGALALLDDKQAGHLRRIRNLAAQPPDDWSGMMGPTTLQEDFGAYRFQLAYMALTLALAHVHRLPAAPGYFRRPMERLIEKMRSPDVWTYWHYVSTGNGPLNRAHGELPAEWNPLIKDNIMYSAYLQVMALLYHYLFRDARYSREGALTLQMRPLYWGSDKTFVCDERTLNDHIYWSMVKRGYLGIACEPNCVFQICNQVPILGFRLHDMIYGTTMAADVTQGYLRAWEEFGVLNESGHFNMMVMEKERLVVPQETPWTDFWLGALMHAWNADFIEQHYPAQMRHWVRKGPEDTLWIAVTDSMFADPARPSARDFGWAAACASEVGDAATLNGLLAFADRFLHARWTNGGYHYERHDGLFDAEGLFRQMDPHTGNALLAYARLNVPGGLRKLYEVQLEGAHFDAPNLADLPEHLDVVEACFVSAPEPLLRVTIVPPVGRCGELTSLAFSNVWGRGDWVMNVGGTPVLTGSESAVLSAECGVDARRTGNELRVRLPIDGKTSLRFVWQ